MPLKPLVWLGSSKPDLKDLPRPVQRTFGFALYLAQIGGRHLQAKALHGFGSAGVVAVFTVRFSEAVFVLHVFQKKATRGRETPKPDLDLIRDRLKSARDAGKEQR